MKFGQWLPDLDPYGHDGLVTARNVFPTAQGYGPVKAYSAVTDALPDTYKGGGAFRGVGGTTALLVGTDAGLYDYTSGWVLAGAGSYTNAWRFAQFGDLVIAVQGAAPLKYTIASTTAATLGGTPPNASMVAIASDFVVMSGVDSANSTVYWSGINDAESWTPGTAQSDTQVLPDGGEVTGLAGGEYMLVFQREQIWRGQYVGPPFIFQFDKVARGIGCIAPGSIGQAGRTVYFISQRGFFSFTDGTISPIGASRVDSTFFSLYSVADIRANISCTVDPYRKLVVWAMPDRLWIYNWELDRWSDVATTVFAVASGMTRSYTFDDIAALYPSGMETVPGSFDDQIWAGGEPFLLLAANDGTLGSFGSMSNLEAQLVTPYFEPIKGRDIRVRAARIDTDATDDVVLSLDSKKQLGGSVTASNSNVIRGNGDTPIRASGRYLQAGVTYAAGATWTYAQGLDLVGVSGGGVQ